MNILTVIAEDAASLGEALLALAKDQGAWSQSTFGTDQERGPIGALKHLEKEAKEAADAYRSFLDGYRMDDTCAANSAELEFREELADCLLLILDASRRSGLSPMDLVHAAEKKMKVNRKRRWGPPAGDTPVEHVKDA